MELKQYQIQILDNLSEYLKILDTNLKNKIEFYNFQKLKGTKDTDPLKSDYCFNTWNDIKKSIDVKNQSYFSRLDGIGNEIPNICFKVPTGGGKTLLAAHTLMRLKQDYFKKINGFVLWMVPSETIYRQTLKNLRNKEHEYRKVLDRTSGGRTKILEKNDLFSKEDVNENLCVMILMLQSGSRKTKEFLKLFRDSGSYMSFFPYEDDYAQNKALLDKIPNLDVGDLIDRINYDAVNGLNIKHSMGNVLKILKPIIIIDEGHRAKTGLAQDTISNFNPSFILELSATPQEKSNIISEVSGSNLKKESMIKLPINLFTNEEADWKHTLSLSVEKNKELEKISIRNYGDYGEYIRPILLIKAESKKQGQSKDHVEDIKNYLIKKLQINEDEIKIKLSGLNELEDQDLMSEYSKVKYIITKDALKEGWDCPFAYTLSILSKSKNENSLTQLIGRVLRQPYAKLSKYGELNQCYVFCNSVEVNKAANAVKKGLESEGFKDISDSIITSNETISKKIVNQKLDKKFLKNLFVPNLYTLKNNKKTNFDYYSDIMQEINWQNYKFSKINELGIENNDIGKDVSSIIDLDEKTNQFKLDFSAQSETDKDKESKLDLELASSILTEKVGNPWQSYRIIKEIIGELINKYPQSVIQSNLISIINYVKNDCYEWFISESENIFRLKLKQGSIFLEIEDISNNKNWKLLDEKEIIVNSNEYAIRLDKNIYKPQYQSNYNELEYAVATYINSKKTIEWWHRFGTQETEFSIPGWKPSNVYPDFLIKINNKEKNKIYFIETKGNHLINEDTNYKKKLFECFNDLLKENNAAGVLKNTNLDTEFTMVFEKNWKNDLVKIFTDKT